MASPFYRSRLFLLTVPVAAAMFALIGSRGPSAAPLPPADGYLFCFWNAENFFDDRKDGWTHEPDRSLDSWFANDAQALNQTLDHLTEVRLKMAPGRGPDISARAECENEHVVELLRDHLNARI